MKILELNVVEFGSLKNRKIQLSDGLNIITGENESGKSTLVLFIKFMLYGLGRKNARGGERERALSFDGHRAAGTMKIECGGEIYLIERNAVSGGRLSETRKITELSSGKQLDGEAGEIFLGIPAEVFEASAYIPQMRASDIKGAQASSALENMLVSADESIDVAGVLNRIDRVRKEYKLNRGEGGLLYDTDMQLGKLQARLADSMQKHEMASEMSARLARQQKSAEQAASSYAQSRKQLDDITNAKIVQKYDELLLKREQMKREAEALEALKSGISKNGFIPDRAHASSLEAARSALLLSQKKKADRKAELDAIPQPPKEVLEQSVLGRRVQNDGGAQRVLDTIRVSDKKRKKLVYLGLAAALLGTSFGVGAAVLAALSRLWGAIGLGAACAVLCLTAVLIFVSSSKAKRQRDALCAEYGASFDEIFDYIERAVLSLSEVQSANERMTGAKALLMSAEEDQKAAEARLYGLLSKTCDAAGKDLPLVCERELLRIGEFCKSREAAEREIYALGRLVESLENELAGYDIDALRASLTIDISTITPELHERAKMKERFDRERTDKLNVEVKNISEALAALKGGFSESPIELEEKIQNLRAKRKADGDYYDALMLAKEHIEAASASMSKNVTPELARRAGEMMRSVSGGVHSELQTNKTLELSLLQNGFSVSSDLLSGGTKDAAYICLRIALMMRVCESEFSPIILDEALCQLDDVRAGRLLSLLSALSASVQCILFTCHTREGALCAQKGIEACMLELEK